MTISDYLAIAFIISAITYSIYASRRPSKPAPPARPRFCKDCLHYSNSSFESQYPTRHTVSIHTCLAPKPPKFDLITGQEFAESFPSCKAMREPGSPCGPDARLFQPQIPIKGNLPNP